MEPSLLPHRRPPHLPPRSPAVIAPALEMVPAGRMRSPWKAGWGRDDAAPLRGEGIPQRGVWGATQAPPMTKAPPIAPPIALAGDDVETQGIERRLWSEMNDDEVLAGCVRELRTTNFVATSKLKLRGAKRLADRIDVVNIARGDFASIYHQYTFAALIRRIAEPDTTPAVYATGTVACMGAKTLPDAILALEMHARALNLTGINCELTTVQIHNVVSSVFAFRVDLQKLHDTWPHMVKYCPDKFPGASLMCSHLPLEEPTETVFEIFDTGKINITGAKSSAEIIRVYKYVHRNILSHVRVRETTVLALRAPGDIEPGGANPNHHTQPALPAPHAPPRLLAPAPFAVAGTARRGRVVAGGARIQIIEAPEWDADVGRARGGGGAADVNLGEFYSADDMDEHQMTSILMDAHAKHIAEQ